MGGSRSSKRRLRIFNRDKGICHWCKQPTVWCPNDTWQSKRRMATVDHLVNKAQAKEMGITEAERNTEKRLVLACRHCNSGREFREQQRLASVAATTASDRT